MKVKLNKKGQAGMTLIEITLVIAVLLGLISVLFIGVGAYKAGSDRAKCILNITSVQKAMRSYANLNADDTTLTSITQAELVGSGLMFEDEPTCPQDGASYAGWTGIPAVGTAYLTCPNGHAPNNTDGW